MEKDSPSAARSKEGMEQPQRGKKKKEPGVVMQQALNKLTGQVEWMVVTQDDDDADDEGKEGAFCSSGEVSEALAMTTYLDMLNDTARNRAYYLAIQKAVKGARHVLDIGAGTGLLSMMAWRAMSDDIALASPDEPTKEVGSITACESFLPMFKLARKLLRANKVGAGVRLIHKRSDEMEVGIDMHCRADVLISEILDSELLGEGLIPTLRHAHQNLLTPNARCVPHKATIYAQLVECEYLWRCHDLPGVESRLADGLVLSPCDFNQTQGRSAALHVDPLSSQMQLLSEPFEVFTFELLKAPDERGQRQHNVPIARKGRAHALISWWVLQLDIDGHHFYSTAPKWIKRAEQNNCTEYSPYTEWCDHWKQVVWFLPGNGVAVSADEAVVVTAHHDSVSVSYDVVNSQATPAHGGIDPAGHYGPQRRAASLTRPERLGALGHEPWRSVVRSAAITALGRRKTTLCAVLDDSLLMAMASASVDASVRVVAMFPGRGVGQEFGDLTTGAKGKGMGSIRVLGKRATSLTSQDLEGRKIDVVMAEPYYASCDRMLPWRLLRFWYERTQLTPLLSDNATIVPFRGSLRGVAVNMPDLWKSRRAVESVEGFDHRPVNREIGACGRLPPPQEGPLLPYAVWQCGRYEELTDVFTVLKFDFARPIQTTQGSVEASVVKSGFCHGIVLWVDWIMDPAGSLVLSTGPAGGRPSYWKQGVKLLSSPVHVDVAAAVVVSQQPQPPLPQETRAAQSLVKVGGVFDASGGELSISVSFA